MKLDNVVTDLGSIASHLQNHSSDEQAHLIQGVFMEIGREALHEFNSTMKSMGVHTPVLDQIEKNLAQQEMQEFFDAHLNVQDVVDLYNLHSDLTN